MDPVISATGDGIKQLYAQGPLVTVLVLCLIVVILFVKKLMDKCDAKWDQSLAAHQSMTDKTLDVVEKNATAMSQLSESIRNLKG